MDGVSTSSGNSVKQEYFEEVINQTVFFLPFTVISFYRR